MWSWSDVVTPWDVKQYAYCPLIPWIARVYGVREPETLGMRLGAEERRSRLARLEGLGLEPPVRLDVQLYCPRLRMAGVADAVAGSRRLAVVEVKAFRRRTFGHFRAQLMAYALLCERCLGPTRAAILLLGDLVKRWDVTAEALLEAERLAARVRGALESERPPPAQPSAKCSACWYRRLCPNW